MGKQLMHWKTAESVLGQLKVKDPGLVKALQGILNASLRDDEFEKRIALATDIAKYAMALSKSKGDAKLLQQLKDTAEVAEGIRKKVEVEKREADRVGLHSMDVQIMIANWRNKPLGSDYSGYVGVSLAGHGRRGHRRRAERQRHGNRQPAPAGFSLRGQQLVPIGL